MELKVIAYARNGHTDKFGIPRQSRADSPILTRIVFEEDYSIREAFRGIEGFSHLWLIWGFEEHSSREGEKQKTSGIHHKLPTESWSPTVRPPRLGGNKRMGVFATRSPFRPNSIGLSSVKLIKACPCPLPDGKGERWELLVSGADLLDGTPIYDIKPYLSYSDSHPDAINGFAAETANYELQIEEKEFAEMPENVMEDIKYILRQDPRPAYHDDCEREYKMDYSGWRVVFRVEEMKIIIVRIEHIETN